VFPSTVDTVQNVMEYRVWCTHRESWHYYQAATTARLEFYGMIKQLREELGLCYMRYEQPVKLNSSKAFGRQLMSGVGAAAAVGMGAAAAGMSGAGGGGAGGRGGGAGGGRGDGGRGGGRGEGGAYGDYTGDDDVMSDEYTERRSQTTSFDEDGDYIGPMPQTPASLYACGIRQRSNADAEALLRNSATKPVIRNRSHSVGAVPLAPPVPLAGRGFSSRVGRGIASSGLVVLGDNRATEALLNSSEESSKPPVELVPTMASELSALAPAPVPAPAPAPVHTSAPSPTILGSGGSASTDSCIGPLVANAGTGAAAGSGYGALGAKLLSNSSMKTRPRKNTGGGLPPIAASHSTDSSDGSGGGGGGGRNGITDPTRTGTSAVITTTSGGGNLKATSATAAATMNAAAAAAGDSAAPDVPPPSSDPSSDGHLQSHTHSDAHSHYALPHPSMQQHQQQQHHHDQHQHQHQHAHHPPQHQHQQRLRSNSSFDIDPRAVAAAAMSFPLGESFSDHVVDESAAGTTTDVLGKM
jgi:hypothetical protein